MPRKKKEEAVVEATTDTAFDKLKALMAGRPDDLMFMDGTAGRWPEDKIIRTGSIGLDRAIGIGGWPKGRIIEVYGEFSSGKTTLCLLTVAKAQEAGVPVVFVDAENAFDPNYAKKLGVDLQGLLVNQPNGLENAIDLLMHLMDNAPKEGLLIVLDSVAQLEPVHVMESDAHTQTIGLKARVWSSQLPKLTQAAKKSNSTLILINQVREKINPKPWEEKKSIPGGNAIKFGTSLRLQIRRKLEGKQEEGGSTGQTVFVDVQKNKVGSPHKKASFWLPAGKPIEWATDIIDEAIRAKVILEDVKIDQDKKTGEIVESKGKTWYSLKLDEKRWEAIRTDDPEAEFKTPVAISAYRYKEFVKTIAQYPTLIELLEEELLDLLSVETVSVTSDDDDDDEDDEDVA
jgi:recombination protein RecA